MSMSTRGVLSCVVGNGCATAACCSTGHVLNNCLSSYPSALDGYAEGQLRQRANAILDGSGDQARFVAVRSGGGLWSEMLRTGNWTRGSSVAPAWGRRAITGETVKPRHLWKGRHGALLPVFLDGGKRLGHRPGASHGQPGSRLVTRR